MHSVWSVLCQDRNGRDDFYFLYIFKSIQILQDMDRVLPQGKGGHDASDDDESSGEEETKTGKGKSVKGKAGKFKRARVEIEYEEERQTPAKQRITESF